MVGFDSCGGLVRRCAAAVSVSAIVGGGLLVGASSAGAARTHRSHAAKTTIKVAYDFPQIDFEAVPEVVGEKQGFYAKHGLNVQIVLPPDTSTTVKMVARGDADIGFDTTADVAFAGSQGIPIKSIANYSMANDWGIATMPGHPFNIHKIKGKSFGVFTDSWTKSMMPPLLKTGHVTPAQVKQIIFTEDDNPALIAGKIDYATNTLNYAKASIESATGKKPLFALGTKYGDPNVPIWVYTGMSSWLRSNSHAVKAFLAATEQATRWAIAHPTAAVNEFMAKYPHNGEPRKYSMIGWKATIPVLRNAHGQLFTQTNKEWRQITGVLKSAKQLPTVLAPHAYYTNAYLPK